MRRAIAIMLAAGACHAAAFAQAPAERLYLCQASAEGPAGEVNVTVNAKGPIALVHVAWYPTPPQPAADPDKQGRTALYYGAPVADPARLKLKNMTVAVPAVEGRMCPARAEISVTSTPDVSRTETFSCFDRPKRAEISVSNFAGGDEELLAALEATGEATVRSYDESGEFDRFRLDVSDKTGRDRLFQLALADLNRIRGEPEKHVGDPRQPRAPGAETYCWDAQLLADQVELAARQRRQSAE